MPLDLEAVERGYGECTAEYGAAQITLRYRAQLDGRALIAMKRAGAGVPVLGASGIKIPDTELAIAELVRVLLPCSEQVPEHERGWDVTRAGKPVAITEEELMALEPSLPVVLLGAILADVNNPNRRRLSLSGSKAGADSLLIASPTTTASSVTRNGATPPSGPSPGSTMTLAVGAAGGSGSPP